MPKRILQGVVVSDKNDKTIVVKVERRLRHPVLKKTVRLSKKYHAHDEKNEAKTGDIVRIEEARPTSKLKRWTPLLTSVPTMPSSRPSTTMAIDFIMSPCANTAAATRPISMSAKYSGAPNFSATSASGGPNSAINSVPTVPAKNEPMAAIASAGPARPCCAI